MYLIPFELLFSEIARQETRSLTLIGNQMPPASDYGLLESYCPDPECDCQRVILNIVSRNEQKQVATINYGFDRSAQDAGPFLDPLNPQSAFAGALLAVIAEHLETDRAYVLRCASFQNTNRLLKHWNVKPKSTATRTRSGSSTTQSDGDMPQFDL